MIIRMLLLFSLFTLVTGCDDPAHHRKQLNPAIYHWKSSYNPTSETLDKLDALNICKQYIRFFDIDIDPNSGKTIPKSVIRFLEKPDAEIVPVVYITNKTFQKTNDTDISDLAQKTAAKIIALSQENKLDFETIQMDCDWSKTTQASYFRFLTEIKKHFETKHLSVTLRLHQIKFMEQTGVPPADRTTLMLYNVGDWTNSQTENSLFDPQVIDQYLSRISEYPLPIDIALPVFQQTLVYRGNRLYSFLQNDSFENISEVVPLQKQPNGKLFVCLENCTFKNRSFRKGDLFRFEDVSFRNLLLVKNAVLSRIQNEDTEVIFYHLEESALNRFSKKQFWKLLE
jgi:hypothetical protein